MRDYALTHHEFFLSSLGRKKRVKVFAPKNKGNLLPCLIVHDGEYVFSIDTPKGYECMSLDKAMEMAKEEMVIIAIEAEEWQVRTKEYSPFPWVNEASSFLKEGEEEGKEYAKWVVKELLPKMEAIYPIDPNPEKHFMLGCSLGALVTLYISFEYPNAFRKVGLCSLASWGNEEALLSFMKRGAKNSTSYFVRVGTAEGAPRNIASLDGVYPKLSEDAVAIMKERGSYFDFRINEGRAHKTKEWEKDMPGFFSFLAKD